MRRIELSTKTERLDFYGYFNKYVAWTQAGLTLILLLGLASLNFFFPTQYSLQAGVHGISAIGAVVFATLLTHRIYPLIRGMRINFESLRRWVLIATALNFLGVVSGNWIYSRYRGEEGPREWILAHAPTFHNVLMEFKEFISLFPFPLMLATSFILFYYRTTLPERRDVKVFVGLMILLAWLFLAIGFVAGLVLAKLRFV